MTKVKEKNETERQAMGEQNDIRVNHLFISGIVQGVFYRDTMQKKAKELNVSGWCRNLENGQVEALIQGNDEQMAAMISWAYKGSDHSVVSLVEVFPLEQSPHRDVIENEIPTDGSFTVKD